MIKGKRGIETSVIIWFVLGIITLLAAIYFISIMGQKTAETAETEVCHDSVVLRSASILGLQPGKSIIPLRCKTQSLKITTTDENKIKKTIADAMYSCWWMLGEGKMDIFSAGKGLKWERYCVICSVIEFDESVKRTYSEITGLNQWLANNKVPGKEFTYWQYITNNPQVEVPLTTSEVKEIYPTNEKYAIIFSFDKETIIQEILMGATGCAAGGYVGAKIGGGAGAAIGSIVPVAGTATIGGISLLAGATGGCIIGTFTTVSIQNIWEKLIGQKSDYYASMYFASYRQEAIKECQNIESIP